MADPLFPLRLDDDDRAVLDACAAAEKLSRTDVLRRALRAYAKKLGLPVPPGSPKPPPRTRPAASRKKPAE